MCQTLEGDFIFLWSYRWFARHGRGAIAIVHAEVAIDVCVHEKPTVLFRPTLGQLQLHDAVEKLLPPGADGRKIVPPFDTRALERALDEPVLARVLKILAKPDLPVVVHARGEHDEDPFQDQR